LDYELRPITADEVLAIFRDQVRHSTAVGDVEPDIQLRPETTVQQWSEDCDLLAWQDVAEAQNQWWGIDVDLDRWEAAMEPAEERTLGGVCELIASHARIPDLRPESFASARARQQAVFAALRDRLTQAGVNEDEVQPDADLGELGCRHLAELVMETSRLAPGVLPTPEVDFPSDWAGLLSVLVLALIGCISVLVWYGYLHALLLIPLLWLPSRISRRLRKQLPTRVAFPGLETLDDFCRAVVDA